MSFSPGYNTMQLHHFFELSADNYSSNIALICDNAFISYQELENRANQLAHFLYENEISKGSIVGILLERSIECYVAILATLKSGAAYVPIEVDYPDERINYIFSDLPFDAVLTSSLQLAQKKLAWPTTYVIDTLAEEISKRPTHRLIQDGLGPDDLCYIIYTSGSTGKPKGVEITQRSICHYVQTASKLYGITSDDKVYQGFSLAFDASLEEFWMAFANGAALVACTAKEVRSGLGLIPFLQQHRVSVFSTVPTLLSALEGHLPDLRLLILGGETCSSALVKRWSRDGLRILNTYGPTEATIIATYAECHPDKEITIGQPLPGYEVLILDEQLQEVADGEEGELCIAGVALARGYVNRPENTAEKFILNPANKNQRLYRTGDLVSRAPNGDLRFAGRVDDQIKLRGFRIELSEIETVIMQYAGIKQAVVSLHALEQPTLVAYLLLDTNHVLDVNELKDFLKSRLPDYMVPALIEILEAFPVLASGKVNRKELPKPTQQKTETHYKEPKTELAREIALVWEKVFDCNNISVNADFFYDLGGHSLHAAKVISNLRKIPVLKNISILDLYKNPTISQLEEKFSALNANSQVSEVPAAKKKYRAPQWKYYLCGVGQFFGCLLQYAVGTLQLLAVILCYSWVSSEYSIISRESQLAFLALFLSMPIISLFITICLKWILLGRVKAGEYPLWGWFYFRWWLVQRLLKNLFLAKFLVGSPLAAIYYRLLGAKIGKNCYLGSMQVSAHDLLTVGDNTSIGSDCRLNGYIVEDGWLKIGSINIGNNCYVGSRAVVGLNTQIEDNGVLDDMSMLHDQGLIPQGAYFAGSPALSGTAPADHVTRKKIAVEESTMLENTLFGILHYLGVVFVMVVYYLCLIPSISLISYYYDQSHYFTTMFFAIPLGAILFLGLYYLCIVICKKIIMDKIKPGEYPLKSFYYFRHWIMVKLLDGDEISVMADTLYLPMFLRLLGAKLGKGVELGETPHIIPDLVTIEEGGFAASSVALAWPSVCNGFISFAPVTVGRRAFVGNVSLLPAGKSMGEGALLGCLSVTPPGDKATEPYSAWLGSPAVFLPKRELFVGFSDKDTFYPSKKLYCMRLAIEFMRIILPSTFSLIALFNMLYVLDYMLSEYSWFATALVLPPAEMFFTVCLVGVLVALKWLMLGRLKPLTKPIWDPFIWKNDVIEYSYNYYTNPHLTNKVLGTPFALWIHRCLGTKAGKRVFTDSAEFSEFDLITIGNDVCINAETIIQTHLYEDRIFKVSNVTIGSGCNIGVGSIVLYNTLMEENSCLGSLSLLMKGERLPENTHWAGIPAQSTALGTQYQQVAPQPAITEEVPGEPIPELL
ncbi:amino acid adenylation domain-containing protein [Legionella sp. PATHC035]|uniref:Pls/PosA family non-ribosomal peptide synthetase n=1 Tax=Legionella sp. PATHC035 TaxID=2992040 RepID=UPI0022447E23|nr:Pls/PosA family non-ribosomal peptide synthetase [Legionella sp. PATHC035]MCW8408689.1 amino acid adenylation domain-containing protein [Legionella sp. PATHC035]